MKKKIWILTLFPEYFTPLFECGVVSKFFKGERGSNVEVQLLNMRDFAKNRYKSVDDYPYGGGPGMILRADVLKRALVEGVLGCPLEEGEGKGERKNAALQVKEKLWVIYPSPRGKLWDMTSCKQMAEMIGKMALLNQDQPMDVEESVKDIVFICGRYEGLDERFIQNYVDEELCIGNYILSGGELAVMVILDSCLRYVPGVLGNELGPYQESFECSLLESPQFTRPRVFEGIQVPEILLSGHHARIEDYKLNERIRLTQFHRPDLLQKKD